MIKGTLKVNNIYYENLDSPKDKYKLGVYPVTSTNERLTIADAEKQLLLKQVPFTSVLSVRTVYEEIELPLDIFLTYKK